MSETISEVADVTSNAVVGHGPHVSPPANIGPIVPPIINPNQDNDVCNFENFDENQWSNNKHVKVCHHQSRPEFTFQTSQSVLTSTHVPTPQTFPNPQIGSIKETIIPKTKSKIFIQKHKFLQRTNRFQSTNNLTKSNTQQTLHNWFNLESVFMLIAMLILVVASCVAIASAFQN